MIEVKGLTRYYDQHPAIVDANFEIAPKLIVGFLGLNGAGKSTLLKMLGRVLPPHAGQIKIDGVDIWDDAQSDESKIGYLPEEPSLYRDMEVANFLRWCGEIRGMKKSDLARALPRVIEMCDLEGKENTVIGTLSHGYKKRVGIAQAVIHSPPLVILDEPISGLDPIQIVEMRTLLGRLKETSTLLISSHILTEISQVCDRILVIKDGVIIADGSEEEISQLSNAHQYTLSAVGLDEEQAIRVFENIDIVNSFTFLPPNSIAFNLKEDRPEEIIRLAMEEKIVVRTMEKAADDLESSFTQLVEREEE